MKKNTKANDLHWQKIVYRLKEIAKEQNISQNKMAELTGIEQPNIARLYSLTYAPNLRTLVLIAEVLNHKLNLVKC